MAAEAGLTPEQVLQLVPQQAPFRFIDELLELDGEHAVGSYTFRADEFFYRGHFPDEPITPGVILLETMCQTGVVALGIYLLSLELPLAQLSGYKTLFTDGAVEFSDIVRPNDQVIVRAHKEFWRRLKLRSRVELYRGDGRLVAHGTVSGIGVKRP